MFNWMYILRPSSIKIGQVGLFTYLHIDSLRSGRFMRKLEQIEKNLWNKQLKNALQYTNVPALDWLI